jgi:hypothetical protein
MICIGPNLYEGPRTRVFVCLMANKDMSVMYSESHTNINNTCADLNLVQSQIKFRNETERDNEFSFLALKLSSKSNKMEQETCIRPFDNTTHNT